MDTDRKWVVVRIEGKIAAISTDYRQLAGLTGRLAEMSSEKRKENGRKRNASGKGTEASPLLFNEITAVTLSLEEVWELRKSVKWEDLMLFGTDFQKKVWEKLWKLTHPETQDRTEGVSAEEIPESGSENRNLPETKLISYSDFADLCQNKAGVRAVAHAISLNPIAVVIPCHLVVPKESVDRIHEIHRKAETTIFKGEDLCKGNILKDNAIDFGEYSLGRQMKRKLIIMELE